MKKNKEKFKESFMIINEDVREWVKNYSGPKFHCLLSDLPYEIGFMGKSWDKSGISYDVDFWKDVKELLYPGAIGMVFFSARSWHRLAVAIEEAGFIIHPSIFLWLRANAIFPKHSSFVDKIPEDSGINPEIWEGYRYGIQALKPAVEPVIVFQKPYEGKSLDCIVKSGAGTYNIDGGKVGNVKIPEFKRGNSKNTDFMSGGVTGESVGRWPSNFIMIHNEDCDEECTSNCPVKLVDEQSGITKSSARSGFTSKSNSYTHDFSGGMKKGIWNKDEYLNNVESWYSDVGGASRYFLNVDYKLNEAESVIYCPKPSPDERNAGVDRNFHPTLKPIKLIKELASLLLPPAEYGPRRILVPFSGSGSEMIGCYLAGWEVIYGIEIDKDFCEIAEKRLKFWKNKDIYREMKINEDGEIVYEKRDLFSYSGDKK